MKFLGVLWMSCVFAFAFGHSHNLILKLDDPTHIQSVLGQFRVTSWEQLGSLAHFRVQIESDLSRQQVMNAIYATASVQAVEVNQNASTVTLESAAAIDSRIIFFVDEITGEAIYDETALNSRIIFFVDGHDSFAPIYDQYHTTAVNAQKAWQYSTGRGQVVAILDTGVDVDHPFLLGALLPGYDFVADDSNPDEVRENADTNQNGRLDEGYGHGSHVAGIVHSVAPGASILPIRVADSDGQAQLSDLIQGIDHAIEQNADVINLSMSIYDPSTLLMEAIERARQAGIVVVTSAGNENSTDIQYPSSETGVLTVASVGPTYAKSAFSNYGNIVDVAAPGERIVSCMPGGTYVARSGTSMAAPIVAAQAAIIFQLVPGNSVQYVFHRVTNNVQNINAYNPGYANKLGKGLADIWDAIILNN